MIKRLAGINLSSKDPRALAEFYQKLGVKVLTEDPDAINYDGVEMGFDVRKAIIRIWSADKWGTNAGSEGASLVFNCNDLEQTYQNFKTQGISCDPPYTAVWGGKELRLKDPEGNNIVIME